MQTDALMGSSMGAAAAGDWRTQMQPEDRQMIVNKMLETFMRRLPISVPDGLNELRKIAFRFEEEIYTAATSQSDYLRKILLKKRSMETMTQQSAPINPGMPNSGDVNQNPADPGSLDMRSQVNNHMPQLAVPNLQSLLSQKGQNLPNSTAAVPASSGLDPALPSITGLSQSNIWGVSHASNLQNMSRISHGSVNNNISQGAQPDSYANPQRQMPGRQQRQQILSDHHHQQQQSQKPLLEQHQLHQQIVNRKLQQQQQQQKALMPPNQLQSTQPALMHISSGHQANQSNIQQTQSARMQSAQSIRFQQGPVNQIQQSVPSVLQQNTQSVSRKQQAQHQHASSIQLAPPISHQTTLRPQQQQMMGHQRNMSNMQQNQLHSQQSSAADVQQKQRLPIQQNIVSVKQQQQQQRQQQMMNQKSLALQQQQQQQQQQLDSQNNMSGQQHQQLDSQNNMSGQQQQHQLLEPLSSISNMQPSQRIIRMHKITTHQQQLLHQSSLSLLQSQGQQTQHQSPQQQLMSQFQPPLQQELLMHQQSNPLQREMQQRIQGPGLLNVHNAMEQKPFIEAQIGPTVISSSTSKESTDQTCIMDWQDECYQKIKTMKEQYLADLTVVHQKIAMILQQQEAHILTWKQSEHYERLKNARTKLEHMIALLHINKNRIPIGLKEKLPIYEKQILSMLVSSRPKKIGLQEQGPPQFQHNNVRDSHPIPQQQASQHFQHHHSSELPVQQAHQLRMNELNELKARHGSGIKSGIYEYSAGQRLNFYNQQLKHGASNPDPSSQNLQASSPQISNHSSPQIDQNGLLSYISKTKAHLQSVNSHLVVAPSTLFTPSPIPVDSEKSLSSISSAGHIGNQEAPVAPSQPHSIAVCTPGISASPLLEECASQDGNQANVPATSKTSATERPIDRLIKVVQSLTPDTLHASVTDIRSVVGMIDRISGSAPGNGSRAAVGEDLVAMTNCRLQARNFMSQDGGVMSKKRKIHTIDMLVNNVSSPGSIGDSFKRLNGFEFSEIESTTTSRIKRLKHEANPALLAEIWEMNQKLIDTVVDVSEEDVDSVAAASELGEGTVVKCSYTAVALSPSLKSHFASAQMSPVMPLRLLVPANYPESSPILLENLAIEHSEGFDDLPAKARSKFSASLRCLSQPMSLGEMAKKWDACARQAIVEYASQFGGGCFSSAYGSWENCLGA